MDMASAIYYGDGSGMHFRFTIKCEASDRQLSTSLYVCTSPMRRGGWGLSKSRLMELQVSSKLRDARERTYTMVALDCLGYQLRQPTIAPEGCTSTMLASNYVRFAMQEPRTLKTFPKQRRKPTLIKNHDFSPSKTFFIQIPHPQETHFKRRTSGNPMSSTKRTLTLKPSTLL